MRLEAIRNIFLEIRIVIRNLFEKSPRKHCFVCRCLECFALIGKIPPNGVTLSNLIYILAMSVVIFFASLS